MTSSGTTIFITSVVAMSSLSTVTAVTSMLTSSISIFSSPYTASTLITSSTTPTTTTVPLPTGVSPFSTTSASADSDTGVLSKGASWGILVAIGPGALFLLILFLIVKCHVDSNRRSDMGLARGPRRERKWWGTNMREAVCDAPIAPMGVDARVAREDVDLDEEAMWMRGPEGPLPWVVWRPRV